jgi:uncharacterized protein
MENAFVNLYRYFRAHPLLFGAVTIFLVGFMGWRAASLRLEEDITRIFPDDERVSKLDYVFRNSAFSDRIVVMVSMRDSTAQAQPDSLVAYAEKVDEYVRKNLSSHIREIRSTIDDQAFSEIIDVLYEHLPVFLEDDDYVSMDSILREESLRGTMENNYRQLISPAGIVTKKLIVRDPLGLGLMALMKLQGLQYDENFELYDNYIVTKDHRHVLIFIRPLFEGNDTGKNDFLLDELDRLIDASGSSSQVMVSCFGGPVVASGNARQLQRDTLVTVSLMVVLLMVVLLGFFRRKRVPILILVPVVFGALFAATSVSFLQESLSILALAVGAVILGVAVDYSLHFLVLLKDTRDTEKVIREIVHPLLIGSGTTVMAFFCLRFTNASVLQDIGLFSAFSLIGAALCSLIILPHLVNANTLPAVSGTVVNRLFTARVGGRKTLAYAILLLTPVFLYFASDVRFNHDIGSLNFMTDQTRQAEKRLETINKASLNTVFVVSTDHTLEGALRKNETATAVLETLRHQNTVNKFSSVSGFLISDSLQRERISRWNSFWTSDKKRNVAKQISDEATRLGFSSVVASNAEDLLSKQYAPYSDSVSHLIRQHLYPDHVTERDGTAAVITLANVPLHEKNKVYTALDATQSQGLDRRMLVNLFVEYVNADFTYIVSVTSSLVFLALLFAYGRIEITLITFLPMLFTWIWILGIMALLGIEFNIVNVIVSTFIFGLGDDYSIFTMDGLRQEYTTGRKNLLSIQTSIFLSAFTTIIGLGVLIFAKHPALRSVAAISVIGIASVFIMSQTLQPFFFRWLVTDRVKRGLPPRTLYGIVMTMFTYGTFVAGSFLLTLAGLLLKLVPFGGRKVRLLFHRLISMFTRALVYGAVNLRKTILNRTPESFTKPSVIVSNHTSFMDILMTTMLHPKLILLTNKWVWNSPVFGGVVRLADYYPVMDGAEGSVEQLRTRTDEGYSVVVFPEGTRSPDGKIKRFHKGAFYIAEALNLPVVPLLIHGGEVTIPKGTIYLNRSWLTMKFLPPVQPDDTRFGNGYAERTKRISRYFKDEHARLAREVQTPHYYRHKLISNYIYKGPVLEWYTRIKTRLEDNYAFFDQLVPRKAKVLDLGCGYGYLAVMLTLVSDEREVTGVDYDEQKIETANHGYLKTEKLNFVCADVTKYPMESYDVIFINDVLHYLTDEEQDALVARACEALKPGGKLVIRDGDSDLEQRHKGTWLTEFFSVRLLRFNKTRNDLNYISGARLGEYVRTKGLTLDVKDETRYTSNVIFVILKPEAVHETV